MEWSLDSSLDAILYILFFIHLLLLFGCVACGILVPDPGIKPMPSAVETWSLTHWAARESPISYIFNSVPCESVTCKEGNSFRNLGNLSPSSLTSRSPWWVVSSTS